MKLNQVSFGAWSVFVIVFALIAISFACLQVRREVLTRQFVSAIDTGNLIAIRRLVSQGAPTNTRGNYERTALMIACREKDVSLTEFLLDHGAKIDLEDEGHQPPLYYGIDTPTIVELLIKRGADVNSKSTGFTPLHGAIALGHLDTAELLLRNGARQDLRDREGWTAPEMAASVGDQKALDLLKRYAAR